MLLFSYLMLFTHSWFSRGPSHEAWRKHKRKECLRARRLQHDLLGGSLKSTGPGGLIESIRTGGVRWLKAPCKASLWSSAPLPIIYLNPLCGGDPSAQFVVPSPCVEFVVCCSWVQTLMGQILLEPIVILEFVVVKGPCVSHENFLGHESL